MHDSELRNAFHQLRDAERARVPRFRSAGPAPSPARAADGGGTTHMWMRMLAAAALILIVITYSLLPHHRRAPEAESIVTWKAPTDVLLRTPGCELLSSVPRIPELPERK